MIYDILIVSLIASTIFTIVICLTHIFTPDIWLNELTDNKIKAEPTFINIGVTALIVAIVVGSSVGMAIWMKYVYNLDFWLLFVSAYVVQIFISVIDLVVIDIIIYMWIKPSWMQYEGIEPLYSYWHHTKASLTGLVIGVPFALVSATIALLF